MYTFIIGGIIGMAFIFAIIKMRKDQKNGGCGSCSGCNSQACPHKK